MTIDVEELKARVAIEQVVGSFVKLTREGRTWRGSCPIHGGDGQNFVVYPTNGKGPGTFHCFSANCHDAGNDVIGFTMQMLGLDFQAACEYLGGKDDWKPNLTKPVRPPIPDRITSKPPANAGRPDMRIKALGEPSRVWEYKDTDGGTLGYVARYETEEGKEIRCWTWGARGSDKPGFGCGHWTKPRPLYGLDRLAARLDVPVLGVEGEKACDAAQALLPGYVAVSWPGGAGAWRHVDWSPLAGRKVLLWPDADDPGIKAMQSIAAILADPQGLACSVRIIDPTGQPEGSDAADWTGTTEELVDWARARVSDYVHKAVEKSTDQSGESCEPPQPSESFPSDEVSPDPKSSAAQHPLSSEPVSPPAGSEAATALDPNAGSQSDAEPPSYTEAPPPEGSTPSKPKRKRKPDLSLVAGNAAIAPDLDSAVLPMELSEVGVASRFCDMYHDDFRVVHEWGGKHGACWLAWDGSRWIRETNRKTAYQKMSTLCCGLKYHSAARGMTEASKSKFETVKFISACLNQAQFDLRLIAAPDIWDAGPMMLGTPAGAVDLTAGKMIESARDQFITRQTTIAPEAGAHPLFDDVIRRAAAGDEAMTAYLWRALGYGAITGCVNEEVFWYLWGKPQCGKTTLIEAIADILGDVDEGGYACQVEIDIFTEQKQDTRNADRLAHLAGARFAYASEMEEGKNFKAALLKMAVGGDRMGGKFLYQERFTFKPSHHIWIFGNQIMHLRTADQGIKRRMHLIEYDDRFIVTAEERDNDFKRKLKAEYPAILHSLIQGALDWQLCGGLGRPEQIERKVDDYMQAEDTLAEFVESCLQLSPVAKCKSSAAYAAFKSWCEKNGEFCPSGKRFTQQMRGRGFVLTRSASGQMFNGFSLATVSDERNPPPSYDRD